jgi:hypothetical protein
MCRAACIWLALSLTSVAYSILMIVLTTDKIKAPIDHIYAFEDALEGYDRQMSGW